VHIYLSMKKVSLIVGGLGVFVGSIYIANQFTKKKEEPTFSLKELGYVPQQEGIKIFNKIAPKYDSKVRWIFIALSKTLLKIHLNDNNSYSQ